LICPGIAVDANRAGDRNFAFGGAAVGSIQIERAGEAAVSSCERTTAGARLLIAVEEIAGQDASDRVAGDFVL
jgi:hypothetical protein